MCVDVPIVRNFTDTPGFRRQQGKGCILGQEENQQDTLFVSRMVCLAMMHMHLHGASRLGAMLCRGWHEL